VGVFSLPSSSHLPEYPVAKPNYYHAKRQKELARKTRQQEKQQKRTAGKTASETAEVGDGHATVDTAGAAVSDSSPVAE
jgi:hypothetical protein